MSTKFGRAAAIVFHNHTPSVWLGGVVITVRSRIQRSRVRAPTGLLSSNNLEQVIYTRGALANSAFHPSAVGKWVAVSIVPGNVPY